MQRGPYEFLKLHTRPHGKHSDCPEQVITRRVREHPGSPRALDEGLLIIVEVIDDMINKLRWECRR